MSELNQLQKDYEKAYADWLHFPLNGPQVDYQKAWYKTVSAGKALCEAREKELPAESDKEQTK